MALAISGPTAISKSDFTASGGRVVDVISRVYTLSGSYTGNDKKKEEIKWFGENLSAFNPRIGNWIVPVPAYTGNTTNNVNDPYYPWVQESDKKLEDAYLANVNDKTKLTLDFTREHWTQHFNTSDPKNPHMDNNEVLRLEASAFDTAGNIGATGFNTSFSNPSDEAPNDYTLHAGIPHDDSTSKPTYVVHERDNPPITDIVTPFFSTYPTADRAYEHRIVYSGDSSFFWDSGQDVVHGALSVSGQLFDATLFVHDWAPHADYTGYTTVTAIGSVIHHTNDGVDVETVLAQDGYTIFIEYHTGTAIKVRVLRAKSNTEELLVTKENKAIETHGKEDN